MLGLGLVSAMGCGEEVTNEGGDTFNNSPFITDNDGPECTQNSECFLEEKPFCEPETQTCQAPPRGALIGFGDGSAESVEFELIYSSRVELFATDLEFNPLRPEELWIIQRLPDSNQPCTGLQPTAAGCGALEGRVAIVFNPGAADSTVEAKRDLNAWHFMRRPPALAFGVNDTFATCGEARTGNFLDDPADFIGPTLWSSDPDIFARDPGPGLNGSHLDMLHATPFCVGIAHERDNVYWLFNGQVGSIDRYDFKEDHGPGADDHSDGEIFRYVEGQLSRVADIPGHMVMDKDTGMLYVADTGNGRVVMLDTSTGSMGGPLEPVYEPLAASGTMSDAMLMEVVSPGVLTLPSGLVLHDGILYVSDNATGKIHAFEKDGTELRSLQTNFTNGDLAGMTVGPDGHIYIASLTDSRVFRIDP